MNHRLMANWFLQVTKWFLRYMNIWKYIFQYFRKTMFCYVGTWVDKNRLTCSRSDSWISHNVILILFQKWQLGTALAYTRCRNLRRKSKGCSHLHWWQFPGRARLSARLRGKQMISVSNVSGTSMSALPHLKKELRIGQKFNTIQD